MSQGDPMGLLAPFRYIHRLWTQYCLECACEGVLSEWQRERPEYIGKVRRWVATGEIPDDDDLRTLCRVYQERLRPR